MLRVHPPRSAREGLLAAQRSSWATELQRSAGNAAVARLIAPERHAAPPRGAVPGTPDSGRQPAMLEEAVPDWPGGTPRYVVTGAMPGGQAPVARAAQLVQRGLWDTVRGTAGRVWGGIKDTASAALQWGMRNIVQPLGRLASSAATAVGGVASKIAEGLATVRPRWGDVLFPYQLAARAVFAVRRRLTADLIAAERRERAAAAAARGGPAGRDPGPGPIEQVDGALRKGEEVAGGTTVVDELVEGAVLGDFKENPSIWNTIGQIAIGFVPYAGQVADARDTVASIRKLRKSGWRDPWEWLNLGLTMVGWVPGVGDVVKGLGRGAIRGIRGSGTKIAKHARRLWNGVRHGIPLLLGKAAAFGKRLLTGARKLGRSAIQKARALGSRALDAGRRLLNGAKALGRRAIDAAGDLVRRARAKGGELLGRARGLLGRAAAVIRGLAERAFRGAEGVVRRALDAAGSAWGRVKKVASDINRMATEKLAAARRWASETFTEARRTVSGLYARARTAATNAKNRAVTAARNWRQRITARIRKFITESIPNLVRRVVKAVKTKAGRFRDALLHAWHRVKERGYRLAQKVGISKPSMGHAKPYSDMTPAERKAFQHSYSNHAKDFGLPNWSGKNAEALRQQFNAAAAEIRAKAQRITVEYKPVGVKGSGVSGGSEPVRFFHYTAPDGSRWYYYETLEGRFVSAGRNRP